MKKLVVLILPILLTGCATMFGDSNDVVSINTNDKNTMIMVDGQYIGNGKAEYVLPRGKSVTITAEKKGCVPSTVQTTKSVAGITWLNILFWPGFIVDAVTGSIQKADPTYYKLTPKCAL